MRLMTLQNPIIKSWLPVFVTAYCFICRQADVVFYRSPQLCHPIWPPAGMVSGCFVVGLSGFAGIFIAELLIHYEILRYVALLESPPELLVFS